MVEILEALGLVAVGMVEVDMEAADMGEEAMALRKRKRRTTAHITMEQGSEFMEITTTISPLWISTKKKTQRQRRIQKLRKKKRSQR